MFTELQLQCEPVILSQWEFIPRGHVAMPILIVITAVEGAAGTQWVEIKMVLNTRQSPKEYPAPCQKEGSASNVSSAEVEER